MELVTMIEGLSPINKVAQGRLEYLRKREELHSGRINLVEINLLVGGLCVHMKTALPPTHYYVVVARGIQHPLAEVYLWTLHDRLPTIPIPLRVPDLDVPINLHELVSRVDDIGRYRRTLHHDQPLPEPFPVSPEDHAWSLTTGQSS